MGAAPLRRGGDPRDARAASCSRFKNVYNGIFAQYANFGWTPGASRPGAGRASAARPLDPLAPGDGGARGRRAARRASTRRWRRAASWSSSTTTCRSGTCACSRARFYDVGRRDNRAAFATLHEVLVVTCAAARAVRALHDRLDAPRAHRRAVGAPARRTCAAGGAAAASRRAGARGGDGGHPRAGDAGPCRARARRASTCASRCRGWCAWCPGGRGPAARRCGGARPAAAAELNVKRGASSRRRPTRSSRSRRRPNFRALGKRFGKSTPLAAAGGGGARGRRAARASSAASRSPIVGRGRDAPARAGRRHDRPPGDRARSWSQEEAGYLVALDPTITPELRREGLARELVSRVQRMRKEARTRGQRPHPPRGRRRRRDRGRPCATHRDVDRRARSSRVAVEVGEGAVAGPWCGGRPRHGAQRASAHRARWTSTDDRATRAQKGQ